MLDQVKQKLVLLITITGLIPILLHFSWLPISLKLLYLSLSIFNFFILYRWLKPPAKIICSLIGLVTFALVIVVFNLRYSADLCMALLAALLFCKLLECRNQEDFQTAVCICLFFNFYTLFYYTGFFTTFLILANTAWLLGILLIIQKQQVELKLTVKFIAKLILLALPVTVLCFFLFPRIPVNFWQFDASERGLTGFSTEFRIDDVRDLALNHQTAFRVNFEGAIPKRSNLYWRGVVFQKYDGTFWKHEKYNRSVKKDATSSLQAEYQVVLEPHGEHWLFALDWPAKILGQKANPGSKTRILNDFTIYSQDPIVKTHTYQVQSVYSNANQINGSSDKGANLQLPRSYNPRTQELARDLKRKYSSGKLILNAALKYFTDNNFRYSLRPQALGRNSVDDFLFKTQIGYCEHYASSLAFLLRAAGLPARIIGGYLGGELNQVGNYLIVRQSDAHVWVEVWLDGQWLRVDPTTYIAPNRLLSAADAISGEDIPYLENRLRFGKLYNLWNEIYLRLDALDFAWNNLIESYDYGEQQKLLSFLGVDLTDNATLTIFIIVNILIALVLILLVFRLINLQEKQDPVSTAYQQFLRKVIKYGLSKPEYMSASEFTNVIKNSAKLPREQQIQAIEICHLYSELCYAKINFEQKKLITKQLIDRIKKFN